MALENHHITSNAERYHGASLDVIQLLSFQDLECLMKKDKYGNTPLSFAIKYEAEQTICQIIK